MRLESVNVANFRLLRDVSVSVDESTTLIVGRNNSGKTSLTEIFRRFIYDRSTPLRLEDFSNSCFDAFCAAYELHKNGGSEPTVREALPVIHLTLNLEYDTATPDFGPLAPFVLDLDPDCTTACIEIRYRLGDGSISAFFDDLNSPGSMPGSKQLFFDALRPRIPKFYTREVHAVDPADPDNRRTLTWQTLDALISTEFISAQRGLDDVTEKDGDVLAKVLEKLFNSAKASPSSSERRRTAAELELAVSEVAEQLNLDVNAKLGKLVPTLEQFGYPGLNGTRISTQTTLDVQRLLTDNTKVRYEGYSEVHLPESYNGLGSRNLIFMLFRLISYYREFQSRGTTPGLQIVFVEEPEVHLHPQMQEVFIRQLQTFASFVASADESGREWPVQLVVSTHSSHIANEAPFSAIRYFLCSETTGQTGRRETSVRDLKNVANQPNSDSDFLHQYLTLTKCDLFFADKAILIEGTVERLLIPKIVEKLEALDPAKKQSAQYITLLEVGGAYAHLFIGLLKLLELPVLIVTDMDSVSAMDPKTGRRNACHVSSGEATSNACIKQWFSKHVTPQQLLNIPYEYKVHELARIAFQIPENTAEACGRTLEDAFILANPRIFDLPSGTPEELEIAAAKEAPSSNKSAFGLKYAISETEWAIPRYIQEGLDWLFDAGINTLPIRTAAELDPQVSVVVGT